VATKRDIARVEGQLRGMKAEINGKPTLVQWMLALVVVAEVVLLLCKFFSRVGLRNAQPSVYCELGLALIATSVLVRYSLDVGAINSP